MTFRVVSLAAIFVFTSSTQAQTLLGSFTWADNGHTYEAWGATDGISATEAATFATSRGGTLATLTSLDENSAIVTNLGGVMAFTSFIGGAQPVDETDPNASWSWVTGEAWSFTNWTAGEPNDFYGSATEQFLEVYTDGTWNDIVEDGDGFNNGLLVEVVPEPSTLLVLAAAGVAVRRRRRNT